MAQLSALSSAAQVTEEKRIYFGDMKHCNVTSDGRGAQQISHEEPPLEHKWTLPTYEFGDVLGIHPKWKSRHLHGRGASLLLEEGIHFGRAVTFSGRLSVQGRAETKNACVEVYGDCTVAHGAELRVENCSNVGGRGGGVYVDEYLHVDGALEVHQSRSRGEGGGVYVSRTSEQRVEPWRRA